MSDCDQDKVAAAELIANLKQQLEQEKQKNSDLAQELNYLKQRQRSQFYSGIRLECCETPIDTGF